MSNTVHTFPATFGEVLASGDAALTNPDVTRTRAYVTVAQAIEAEERAAVRMSVDEHFPVVAAFLERPAPHPLPLDTQEEFLERMHAVHARMLEDASPAVVAWVEQLEEFVATQPNPAQALAAVDAAVQETRQCVAYDWCVERGNHGINHHGAIISVTAPGAEQAYVDAQLMGFGPGTELIGLVEWDLTPAQARQEAAKLREFADQLEGLADAVGGDR